MHHLKHYLRLLMLFSALAFSNFLSAQAPKQAIKGKVIDSLDQAGLIGATVSVKNTNFGTVTNENGEFSLNCSVGDVLEVNYIGYSKAYQTIIEGNTNYTIIMIEDIMKISDVVVTALGVRKEKKLISYASQEVSGADLLKAREPNTINGLTGKVAGLTVGASSELLGNPQVLLRGGAIYLYVVDGVPINSDTWNINADDIESYTVLKGPVASSLYGYRGQNGAIIITTKKGTKNKKGVSVEFNSSTMFQKGFIALPRTQDLYGPGDHGAYGFVDGKGAGINDGDYDIWGPKFSGQLIPQYDSPIDPVTGNRVPTPWTARGTDNLERFVRTGVLNNNSVAVSSSGDKYNLRFSVSNSYQKGIIPNTDLQTINFNLSNSIQFSKKLKLDANLNYNRQFTDNIPDVNYGPNSVIYNITIWGGADWNIDDMKNYWQPGKENVQSNYEEYQRYHNPYFMSYEWLRGHYKNDIYGYTNLNYKFNDYLELMGRTSVTTYNLTRTEKMPFSAHPYGREEGLGDYREDKRALFENNTEAILKLNTPKIANLINISGFAGGNIRYFQYASSFVTTDYMNVPNVYAFSNSKNPVKAYSFNSEMIVKSAFYSFDIGVGKYLNLNTTGRVDKLSALTNTNNTFFYPSLSANTIVSDYIKMPKSINYVKVRTSYAQSRGGGAFVSNTIGATPNNSYPLGYGSEYSSSYGGPSYAFNNVYSTATGYNNTTESRYSTNLIDANIKPDNRTNFETGLEFKMLKQRLGFDFAYFNYVDGPQIFTQGISQASGYVNNIINATKTKKTGAEFTITGTPVKNNHGFTWDIVGNWSKFTEKFLELPEGLKTINTFYKVGSRTDEVWIRKFARTQDGQVINDGGGRPIILPVAQFAGHSNPDWVWSIYNKVGYKNFNLGFQFDGRVGGIMEDYVRKKTMQGGRNIETTEGALGIARDQDALGVKSYLGEGVQVSGTSAIKYDPTTGEIINYNELQFKNNETKTFAQDYVSRLNSIPEANMMSKTYTKLREVVLTYNLPSTLVHKASIQTASISFVARNVLYFMKDNKFKDVDIDQFANQSSTNLQTPTMRSYGVNLNLTF